MKYILPSYLPLILLIFPICADDGGATQLGLLLSGIIAAVFFCGAFVFYLCKVRSRTRVSYRDYVFNSADQKQIRKNLDTLKLEDFEGDKSYATFLGTMPVSKPVSPRNRRVLSVNQHFAKQKIDEMRRMSEFSGTYTVTTRILRTDNVAKSIWILKGTEIYEQWQTSVMEKYHHKESKPDISVVESDSFPEDVPASFVLSPQDSDFLTLLQEKIDNAKAPNVYFDDHGDFLCPFLPSFESKPYWESYDGIRCCKCNTDVVGTDKDGRDHMMWWYNYHRRLAYCKKCLPKKCTDDSVQMIYCQGQDTVGDFQLYGVTHESTGNVVAYQQYRPNTKRIRKKLTGKVRLHHNYGHSVFMRLKPAVEDTYEGYWYMNTRSWEDSDRVVFTPNKSHSIFTTMTTITSSPNISMATIDCEKLQDENGDISEVGTFMIKGAELVGFLEFHPSNYPTFTFTFSKNNKRLVACAPNLCFGEVSAGDRLICVESEDLWDSTKEHFFDIMHDSYDKPVKIKVDRGHNGITATRSHVRLLFRHDKEIHPVTAGLRESVRMKRTPESSSTNQPIIQMDIGAVRNRDVSRSDLRFEYDL